MDRVGLGLVSSELHEHEPDARTRICGNDSNFEEIELRSGNDRSD